MANSAADPSVLWVETGTLSSEALSERVGDAVIDYRVYERWPRWWRRLEEKLRLDIGLAIEAKKRAGEVDLVWAGSEKVAIPLSLICRSKPIVAVCHYPSSRWRKPIYRLFGLFRKWAGVGYITDYDKTILASELGADPDKLFCCIAAPLDRFSEISLGCNRPIISLGVTKRDYKTLIAALARLPGCDTAIYASSQYGDVLRDSYGDALPPWVRFVARVSQEVLTQRYEQCRFVVLPLTETDQSSAGVTVALEAAAAGKAIIATRTSGTATYIRDGETGILVPPYDVKAWQEAIEFLWNAPAAAQAMGIAARKHVEDKHDAHKINQRITEVLRKAATQAPDHKPSKSGGSVPSGR
jgi:glycosyltransferase involved in cell wall biosynthesis